MAYMHSILCDSRAQSSLMKDFIQGMLLRASCLVPLTMQGFIASMCFLIRQISLLLIGRQSGDPAVNSCQLQCVDHPRPIGFERRILSRYLKSLNESSVQSSTEPVDHLSHEISGIVPLDRFSNMVCTVLFWTRPTRIFLPLTGDILGCSLSHSSMAPHS